jgi:hypothetical protein
MPDGDPRLFGTFWNRLPSLPQNEPISHTSFRELAAWGGIEIAAASLHGWVAAEPSGLGSHSR